MYDLDQEVKAHGREIIPLLLGVEAGSPILKVPSFDHPKGHNIVEGMRVVLAAGGQPFRLGRATHGTSSYHARFKAGGR